MQKVIALLHDVELFRPVTILDNVYSVIFRDGGTQVIIRSSAGPRPTNIELWLNIGEDYVSRFSKLNHKPELPSIMEYRYLACESKPWYAGDTDLGYYFLATPVTEEKGLQVEQAILTLFCGHLNKCEDKLAYWPMTIEPSKLER
jgi:hypothetical protein